VLAQLASAYALAGRKNKALTKLASIQGQVRQSHVCGFNIACVHASLGENEQAFTFLEKACQDCSH